MKTITIIQARMGSTRLPGKVMKRLCDKTVLAHVVTRVKACSRIDEIIVATTTSPHDNCLVEEAEKLGVKWFKGSQDNVLERYYLAAKEHQADTVIRVTSDCPLLDVETLDQLLSYFQEENSNSLNIDYLSNSLKRSFPRGLDVEIFTYSALELAYNSATKDYEREHVTPYIRENPDIFSLHNLNNDDDLSYHRWTLDTPEDYELIKIIYDNLYDKDPLFGMGSILKFLGENPDLININTHIKQKQLGE
ncbi:glycosyltransferase family protein [Cuspidothrix issatschenkoi LEGE 03284]|uniref:cytidylyltransferase domain-containing protein n=1 Tax=Cuspidothrix issatschenkoi TaxID=230752 RepID=UPI001882BB0A|nr:glycosyltransferase family protein [Cuspidothrix issatschenkoi]MBE9231833.1 glycosyltransferase family protein [Cuspidothrix issatschenkoi LEGE 03284]